jgi:hypothetical protein
VLLRLPEQVFAGAKADFEPDIIDGFRKVRTRIGVRLQLHAQARQQRFTQIRLMRGELRPLAPPVEKPAAARGRRAVRRRA